MRTANNGLPDHAVCEKGFWKSNIQIDILKTHNSHIHAMTKPNLTDSMRRKVGTRQNDSI
jgi:hypothetical protein